MIVAGTISSKDNLCDYCQLHIATCPKANHIKFGDGVGNDNVIECSGFILKQIDSNCPIVGKPAYSVTKTAESLPLVFKIIE